jgi:hypothetical protein
VTLLETPRGVASRIGTWYPIGEPTGHGSSIRTQHANHARGADAGNQRSAPPVTQVLHDLMLDLCHSIIVPAVATPRSLDPAHLRRALGFRGVEPIDRFLTMDESQPEAATELGLPV